jgi:hypothetical protein
MDIAIKILKEKRNLIVDNIEFLSYIMKYRLAGSKPRQDLEIEIKKKEIEDIEKAIKILKEVN